MAIATASARLKGAWPVLKTDRLPNPNDEREERERAVCAAANAEIQLSMAYGQSTTIVSLDNAHVAIGTTTPRQRAKMAQYANMHGLQGASRHRPRELGHDVP